MEKGVLLSVTIIEASGLKYLNSNEGKEIRPVFLKDTGTSASITPDKLSRLKLVFLDILDG
jgi:hypothetical protein